MANNDTRTAEGKETDEKMEDALKLAVAGWRPRTDTGIDVQGNFVGGNMKTNFADGFRAGWIAANDERDRLKAMLAEIKYYVRDHTEPGHECVQCIIEGIISGQLKPSLFTDADMAEVTEAAAGGGEKL